VFLRMGASVVAVEPDPVCQLILAQKYHRLRLNACPVQLISNAVGSTDGVERMWVDGDGSALNTLSSKWVDALRADTDRSWNAADPRKFASHFDVNTVTLDTLIANYGMPFYIKIDVEGYEDVALRGLTKSVPYLSFEVNLPEFVEESIRSILLLDR